MNLLFVHQNLPSQFVHLMRYFGNNPAHRAMGIRQGTPEQAEAIPGLATPLRTYQPRRAPTQGIHNYLYTTEAGVLNGQAVATEVDRLRYEGFVPDLTLVHGGWGEGLYLKDMLPDRPLVNYCEFFYRARGLDCDFDPEFPIDKNEELRIRTKNALHLLTLEACDAGVSPTRWQRSVQPLGFQSKIHVIHEGVDTSVFIPDPQARVELPDGTVLTPECEVITFAARSLEPYRGFHVFMRALPEILKRRPRCQVVITGDDKVTYGRLLPEGETWRARLLQEVDIDPARVHFLGFVPRKMHLGLLQVSTVHVYLTVPFVLSWSLLEALSTGAVVVGSDTAPVREVIQHGANGLLTDYFSRDALVDTVVTACENEDLRARLSAAARSTATEHYDLKRCLTRYDTFLTQLAAEWQ